MLEYNGMTGALTMDFAQDPYLVAPRGLAFGPNGDLFVSSLSTNQVLEYKGATSAFVKSGFSNVKVFAQGGGLSLPEGLVFGPNGDLFVSSLSTNQVLEYNGTTGVFVKIFAQGGGLSEPIGLVFGPNGDLFVSSAGTNQVLEYNGTTGAFVKVFAQGGSRRLSDPVLGPNLDGPTFLTFGRT